MSVPQSLWDRDFLFFFFSFWPHLPLKRKEFTYFRRFDCLVQVWNRIKITMVVKSPYTEFLGWESGFPPSLCSNIHGSEVEITDWLVHRLGHSGNQLTIRPPVSTNVLVWTDFRSKQDRVDSIWLFLFGTTQRRPKSNSSTESPYVSSRDLQRYGKTGNSRTQR